MSAGTFSAADAAALQRAVALARRGCGEVEPNPPVGAVLHRDGVVLAEGFHRAYGEAHAEIEALRGATAVGDATLVVTLEPCSATGKKTPPCVDALLKAGVRRVVVGEVDPDPRHRGRGLAALAAAGVDVVQAPPTDELVPRDLLAPFRAHLARRRAWLVLKWASGLDGRFAGGPGAERWISGEAARREVHRLRGHVDAIVVGSGTVLRDDPQLTARPPGPRTPTRVLLDRRGRIPATARVFREAAAAPVLWITGAPGAAPAGVERLVVSADDAAFGLAVAEELRRRGLVRALVEGGPTLAAAFLRDGLADAARVFVAAVVQAGSGAPGFGAGEATLAQPLRPRVVAVDRCGDDAWFKLSFS